ncbi:3-oxoacyl-[acyl-carrier-protein] synthase 2 [Parapedobacter pyrenivorans]|uniref:3-oxoacyl-[acyl-carrier-protein] synthase 2 n=2 Tax=Parapedobacter pyrenivorans TaxID=1305674 RepID=A0A917M6D7_9SPHI|nr:3-oxoacyl-[acyl-carrier-protein] synthase 2 [Parapedobacter pyrenivorans]
MGAVTPLGNDVKTFWQQAVSGASGAGLITRFNAEQFRTQIACEVKGFAPEKYLDRNEIKRSDLFTQFALFAAAEAMEDAGLDVSTMDPFDIGVIWGAAQGGMQTFETEVTNYVEGGYVPRFSPFFVPRLITNMASGLISLKYGLQGINYTTVSACATANTAIMDAFNYIRMGKAKAFITGGSEAPITPASIGGFSAMKAMSTRNDDPTHASRPFDKGRDGFVMAEGAGALLLEEYEHAKKRGAHIYAEIVGASMTADAYHMTAPHPEGLGASKAMELALQEAQLNPAEVDYINPHATSTPIGDIAELNAVGKVFRDTGNLSISGTKSMTGHLLGAAAAVEAILAIKAITDGVVPPTINMTDRDEAIPQSFRIVAGEALERKVDVSMSNAFGFGGHNATVVFKRV